MSEKKIKVPEGMLKAYVRGRGFEWPIDERARLFYTEGLSSALR